MVISGYDDMLHISEVYVTIPILPLESISGDRQTQFNHPPFHPHNILVRCVRLKNIDGISATWCAT